MIYIPCFLHVTGHNCQGPTHQLAGQGSSLQCRVFSLGRVPSAFDQQFSSSTIPIKYSIAFYSTVLFLDFDKLCNFKFEV